MYLGIQKTRRRHALAMQSDVDGVAQEENCWSLTDDSVLLLPTLELHIS